MTKIDTTHVNNCSLLILRNILLIVLQLSLGCRFGELSNLNANDILFTNCGADVTIGKSKTDQKMKGSTVFLAYDESSFNSVYLLNLWLNRSQLAQFPNLPLFPKLVCYNKSKSLYTFNFMTHITYEQGRQNIKDFCDLAHLPRTKLKKNYQRIVLAQV